MQRQPTVTVLIPAFNAEAFVEAAIRSALDQDYPPHLVDVIVVDDGSTDRTGAIVDRLAAQGRLRLVRQDNRGLVGAVNRAAEEARGELLALLDADDVWPADKLRRQAEVFQARPEAGLVYTDMRVIDAEGRVVQDSWLGGAHPPQGREVGALLAENRVTASSVVVRASLRDHLFPIPDAMPWADWWLAVVTALVADVAYLAEPKTLYRFHGSNMSLGTSGAARLRELRGALCVQRFFLRQLTTDDAPLLELERAWDGFGRMAEEAIAVAGSAFTPLVDVDDDDRREALVLATGAETALVEGEREEAVALAIRAAAADPTSDAARDVLLRARALAPLHTTLDPLRDARDAVVRIEAGELLRSPELLTACAEHLGDVAADFTVAIDAAEADADAAGREIADLVDELGAAVSDLDLVLVTGPLDALGRARLVHGVTAQVSALPAGPGAPTYAPDALPALRERLVSETPGATDDEQAAAAA